MARICPVTDGPCKAVECIPEPSTNTDLWQDAGWVHGADGDIVPARPDQSPPVAEWIDDCARHKRPSIHMPRWASRLTLEITDVRVERLNAISEADASAEGVLTWARERTMMECSGKSDAVLYRELWAQINGTESWDANPWVWAVSFKVHHTNVDALLKASA